MIQTDLLIIGAGPVGLFTVFEAGLLKLKCHLIDVLPQVGGQLSEIYPKKPIYDIPGYPSVLASDLVGKLMEQIKPFKPSFTLGEKAVSIMKTEDGRFNVESSQGTIINAGAIAIAGGLGSFEPRKPPIEGLEKFESHGVDYFVKEPEKYRDKKIIIAGGGDSALDWTIELADIAKEITLVHRRTSFRGALDSVEKVMALAEAKKINLITDAQVIGVSGDKNLTQVVVKQKEQGEIKLNLDYFIPLFGLSPKLGPIADWDLAINKNAIEVDTFDYRTTADGIYAIGDINTYPGKLKLILCGFHEATLMVQSVFKRIYPNQKLSFKYTTVTGIEGLS